MDGQTEVMNREVQQYLHLFCAKELMQLAIDEDRRVQKPDEG